MAREPKTTQDDPTLPRPIDDDGRALDEHGLPLNGPARLRALAGKPDPRDPPDDAIPTDAPSVPDSQD